MNIHPSLAARAMLAFCVAVVAGGSTAQADTLDDIIEAWSKRRENIRRVAISARGKSTDAKGAYNESSRDLMPESTTSGDIPPKDYTYDTEFELVLDFDRNWAKKSTSDEEFLLGENVYIPRHRVNLFDGREFQEFRPRHESAMDHEPGSALSELLLKDLALMNGIFFNNSDWAPFISLGIVPIPNWMPTPKLLQKPLRKEHLRVQGTVGLDGRDHVLLHTISARRNPQRYWELWVDRSRESTVSRAIMRGRSRIQIDLRYKQSPHGRILDGWKWVWSEDGKTMRWTDMQITNVEVNLPITQGDFRVEPEPGMIITDERSGGRRQYVKGAPGEPDQSIDEFLLSQKGEADMAWPTVTVAAVALGALAAFILLATIRKRRIFSSRSQK